MKCPAQPPIRLLRRGAVCGEAGPGGTRARSRSGELPKAPDVDAHVSSDALGSGPLRDAACRPEAGRGERIRADTNQLSVRIVGGTAGPGRLSRSA